MHRGRRQDEPAARRSAPDEAAADRPAASRPGAVCPEAVGLAPALHIVATPIGAARDITLRALDILRAADLLAAEDTRSLRRLMEIHGIPRAGRPLVAYHDHSPPSVLRQILAALAQGGAVALVSEAGTPLVSDPGYRLVAAAVEAGHQVRAAPGPSALLAALAVAGLPTDRFLFAGFLPPKAAARRRALAELAAIPATLVFYESPRRLGESLASMAEMLGPERRAAVCRELTKRFEEVRRGPLGNLVARLAAEEPPRGEIVVVVGPPAPAPPGEAQLDTVLADALRRQSVKEAAAEVALALALPRRRVYARALELRAKAER